MADDKVILEGTLYYALDLTERLHTLPTDMAGQALMYRAQKQAAGCIEALRELTALQDKPPERVWVQKRGPKREPA